MRSEGAPILTRGSVRLVPFSERHLSEQYVSWLNDPEVVRYSEQRHRIHTPEDCRAFVEGYRMGPSILWAIEVTDDNGLHIGNITANIDPNNRLADIGILIGERDAHGQGYGFAAWMAVVDYLLEHPHIDKISAGCLAPNRAMLRIMERAGMKPDGVRHKQHLLDGERVDIVHMAFI